MVFITAGMGGGTGTGGAPVVASIAKEKGLLVIGVVTSPFRFEGSKKISFAEEGIENLGKYCDTLIVIENERLLLEDNEFKSTQPATTLSNTFRRCDEVLYGAIRSITDPISQPGIINLDYRDMDTTLRNAGHAVMGSGVAEGKDRGLLAVKRALSSPLLRYQNTKGAKRVLMTIFSSGKNAENDLKIAELSAITSYLEEELGDGIEMMIWGHAHDPELDESIRVNIIVSGFPKTSSDQMPKMAPRSSEKKKHTTTPPHLSYEKTERSYAPQAHAVSQNTRYENKTFEHPIKTTGDEDQQKVRFYRDRTDQILNSIRDGESQKISEKEIEERLNIPAYIRKRISLNYNSFTEQKPEIIYLDEKED